MMGERHALKLPTKWRVIRLSGGVDFSAEAGGGSLTFKNTYAVPDDGRDFMDLTLGELKAYPAASALAMLNDILDAHSSDAAPPLPDRSGQ